MATKERCVCRLCRREGVKLYLKGSRCEGPKCAVERRDTAPGQHGWRRGRRSEYATRLREKQRAKRYYGLREAQFRIYFEEAERQKGDTGENLFRLLETRLDNVVYRSGLAESRYGARQFIGHGHVTLNGKRLDRSSAVVKVGDVIGVYGGGKNAETAKAVLAATQGRGRPDWLAVEPETPVIRVAGLPQGEELTAGFQPQLIVELCSR